MACPCQPPRQVIMQRADGYSSGAAAHSQPNISFARCPLIHTSLAVMTR